MDSSKITQFLHFGVLAEGRKKKVSLLLIVYLGDGGLTPTLYESSATQSTALQGKFKNPQRNEFIMIHILSLFYIYMPSFSSSSVFPLVFLPLLPYSVFSYTLSLFLAILLLFSLGSYDGYTVFLSV